MFLNEGIKDSTNCLLYKIDIKRFFINISLVLFYLAFLFLRSDSVISSSITIKFLRTYLFLATLVSIYYRLINCKIIVFYSASFIITTIAMILSGSFFDADCITLHSTLFTFLWASFLFAVLLNCSNRQILDYLCIILVLYIIANYAGLYQHMVTRGGFFEISTWFNLAYRYSGLSDNANLTTLFIIFSIIAFATVAPWKRAQLFNILLFSFPLILSSGSKKSIIAFIAVSIALSSRKKLFWFGLIGLTFVFLNFSLIADSFIIERFAQLLKMEGYSNNLRAKLIEYGIADINDSGLTRQFFGLGPHTFQRTYGAYSHNNYIELFYSYGFFFIAFLALLNCMLIVASIIRRQYFYFVMLMLYLFINFAIVIMDPIMMLLPILGIVRYSICPSKYQSLADFFKNYKNEKSHEH